MYRYKKNESSFKKIEIMKLFLIGTGLIGGSMSKDLRKLFGNIQIHGIDKNELEQFGTVEEVRVDQLFVE